MAIFGVDWGTFWGKINWLDSEKNKLWEQNQKHWDKHGELERELGRIRYIVEGDGKEWGLVQHVHGKGQPGEEGLWGSVDILKNSLREAQEKNRALEARLDSLQEKYEKLSKLLIEAARKQLGDK